VGFFSNSSSRAFVRSGMSQFIPKVFDGLEVRALCVPVKFFHTKLI